MTAAATDAAPLIVESGRLPDGARRTPGIPARLRSVILAAVALCVMLTGCTATATGRPMAAPDLGHWQPPPIPPSRLGDLLLSTAEINAISGTTNLTMRTPVSRMWHDDDAIPDLNCLDAYSPIEAAVYNGSNWNDVKGQFFDDSGLAGDQPSAHVIIQAVVGFRDADSAQQFFAQAKQRWSNCANRTVSVVRPGRAPIFWVFTGVDATDNTLSMMQTQEGSGGWSCQRAMGIRNNVIIDTMWCGFGAADQANTMVTKIADEVSQA